MSQDNVDQHFDKRTHRLKNWVAMEVYNFDTDEWLSNAERKKTLQWTESPPVMKGAAGVVGSEKVGTL